ncbi:MAG: PhoH family protein [Candidatus Adiutrix sp.]|jgi:phosphate starvation-inducible PhoH-like protein|nr:PhoH family protein [Candidatus Adiutrix sp.]
MSAKKRAAPAQGHIGELEAAVRVYGPGSRNLKVMSELLGLKVDQRGHELTFGRGSPEKLAAAQKTLTAMRRLAQEGTSPSEWDVECLVNLAVNHPEENVEEFLKPAFESPLTGRRVSAKNPSQREYLKAMETHDLVFGLGPAGTGKTYLAVAMAVAALGDGRVERVVVTRPAVEAGEKLGFLPGDLAEKINPYLRPLYDALDDLLAYEKYVKLTERRAVEVAPLAFMRGRTLSRAFVILDEAQNCTREQMKMFLTRLGPGSKAVVTGDLSQSDLPGGAPEGLAEAAEILAGVDGIAFCRFRASDVVRHRLVKNIIEAYDRAEAKKKASLKRRQDVRQ